MEFLQPLWLFGASGIIVPIIIHFWYQKKGRTIQWAASRWLTDRTTLQHRGIRLHNWPLMLVRCLIVIVLSVILAKMLWGGKEDLKEKRIFHLVQQDQHVGDNFRFEMEEALKKGEKVEKIRLEELQNAFNRSSGKYDHFHVYLAGSSILSSLPKMYVPGTFQVHVAGDTLWSGKYPYLLFGKNKLFADPVTRQLTSADESKTTPALSAVPVHTGSFKVLLSYRNADETKIMRAALEALTDIYGVTFEMNFKPEKNKRYDWIASDKLPATADPDILYLISGHARDLYVPENVLQISDSLHFSQSETVRNGRLPELIGEAMVRHYGLAPRETALSEKQAAQHFEQTKPILEAEAQQARKVLILLLIGLVMLERWLAMGKNQSVRHAQI